MACCCSSQYLGPKLCSDIEGNDSTTPCCHILVSNRSHTIKGEFKLTKISPKTDKGTVIRQAFYKEFAKEIDEVYEGPNLSLSTNAHGSEAEVRAFLRENIYSLLRREDVSDNTDLFTLGLDSLQALRLRALVLKRLPIRSNALAMNIAFDFPSIDALTQELLSLQKGQTTQTIPVEEQMTQLIEKYGTFQPHQPKSNDNNGQYIVYCPISQ